ncbi:hypothetical protein BOX15_Mlig007504g2 [Macrostomum lignano]|uniref:Uncharacterized protein n=1 Tax=Macrostomum lignano TaxID=282301 RepID=A0A267GJ49_9PLAT|nr:hypothetical protein BOX15_Mlig007504g2 [Macrostomum lignano]
METDSNKQRQLQEMLGLQLHSREMHTAKSVVNPDASLPGQYVNQTSYAPARPNRQLRPLVARRDDQMINCGPGNYVPMSGGAATPSKTASTLVAPVLNSKYSDTKVINQSMEESSNIVRSEPRTLRPVPLQNFKPSKPQNYMYSPMGNELERLKCLSKQHNDLCSQEKQDGAWNKLVVEGVQSEQASTPQNYDFRQKLLADKELELQQLYQSQQQEKDRSQMLKAQVEKDIELQLTQARQELELQRQRNAELEKRLKQRQDAIQQLALELNLNSQLDEEECNPKLDTARFQVETGQQLRPVEKQSRVHQAQKSDQQSRNFSKSVLETDTLDQMLHEMRSKSAKGKDRLDKLLLIKKLESLKQQADYERLRVSDKEDRLVRREQKTKRQLALMSESEIDSDVSSRSENSSQQQRQKSCRGARSNWQAREIGDAFRNQSSLMQLVDNAAVNLTLQNVQSRGGSGETDESPVQETGRRLRSRVDYDRPQQQRDTGDGSRQLQHQKDCSYLSFHAKHGRLKLAAENLARMPAAKSPLHGHRIRSRSCERMDFRRRHSPALIMSSSSGRPIGMGLSRLLEESQRDSDDSSKGYNVRSAMEVDVSFSSSEESGGEEEQLEIKRQKRLAQQRKSEGPPSTSPSDKDRFEQTNPEMQNRISSRRSSVINQGENKNPGVDSEKHLPGSNRAAPGRRSFGNEDDMDYADQSRQRRQSEKSVEGTKSYPRRSFTNDVELADDDEESKPQVYTGKQVEVLERRPRFKPRHSVGNEDEMDYADQNRSKRHSEKQSENPMGLPRSNPRRSVGNDSELDNYDQSRPMPIKSSSSPSEADRGNKYLPESSRFVGNRAAARPTSTDNGMDSMPEEWSGRPVQAQYPSPSDENTNTDENEGRKSEPKMFKLPEAPKPVVLDSDDDENWDEDRRRRIRRKQSRRPSKLSIASHLSRNPDNHSGDDEDEAHEPPRTLNSGADENPSSRPRRQSEKSIKSAAETKAGENENVDSRFQDSNKAADPAKLLAHADSDASQLDAETSDKDIESTDATEASAIQQQNLQSKNVLRDNTDTDVQPALREKSLNKSMKLGIAGEQTGLQQPQEGDEGPTTAAPTQRHSWRSKHNKAAPDSYTQDSEHRGVLDDTRDTDSDTRSTQPPQGSYALRPETGGKVQLLARRFFQHQDQMKQKKAEAEAPDSASDHAKKEASKPGAAATSKFKDEKPTAAAQEKRALVKSVSRLPATEGGAVQIKPEDTLSVEDIEACKSRAQRKNEERRKRRENKETGQVTPVAPVSDLDEDDDVAPVMQQESLGEQLRRSHKEPDHNEVAPMTGDELPKPEEKRRDSEGVMALEKVREQEPQQQPKPHLSNRASKPKESVAARAPVPAVTKPQQRRRKRRRSSRLEPVARSMSLPPQPTVIYCCPPCPPANCCRNRCAMPNCYRAAGYCCRRC